MSTALDLTTEVYPGPGGPNSAVLSGSTLVPYDTLSPAAVIILSAPILGAGGSGTIHVTGTLNALAFGVFSALSPDSAGWSGSFYYTLTATPSTTAAAVTQTIDLAFAAGTEQYDDAITAGEVYVALNPSNYWTQITAISYDYAQPGLPSNGPVRSGIRPLRQYPRTDGLGASTAPRLWPPPRSVQASNRRAGGYL